MTSGLLSYRSTAEPSKPMVSAMLMLSGWTLVTASFGLLSSVAAILETYSPTGDQGALVWLVLLIVWLPVTGGCAIAAKDGYHLQQRHAAAAKNTIATLRELRDSWCHGYTFLGIAAALGAMTSQGLLVVMGLASLVIWAGLHAWLIATRRMLIHAARDPEAEPSLYVPPASEHIPTAPAAEFDTRADAYLRVIKDRAHARAAATPAQSPAPSPNPLTAAARPASIPPPAAPNSRAPAQSHR